MHATEERTVNMHHFCLKNHILEASAIIQTWEFNTSVCLTVAEKHEHTQKLLEVDKFHICSYKPVAHM